MSRLRFHLGSKTSRFVALIFAFQIVATGGILYFVNIASERALAGEQQAVVAELRDELLAGYEAGGQGQLVALINERMGIGNENAALLLVRPDRTPIAGNITAWPTIIPSHTRWQVLDIYRTGASRPERIGFIATALPDGSHLLTGHVIESSLTLTHINESAMSAAFVVAIPLTLAVALLLARILSRSINMIGAVTTAVEKGDLSQRIITDGSDDSFDRLGSSINALLDRIEVQLSEMRVVTDSLAHDLRSPVTRLKSTIERAMAEISDPASLVALETISAEAEALMKMLSTALEISRAEAGIGRDRFSNVDIGVLVTDLAEIYGPLAEDKGIALTAEVSEGVNFLLNRELISQVIGNLIENALKYADGATSITLSAGKSEGGVEITVADNGGGIASDRREEALKRFGRLDPARHIGGSGLGLSLARAVARMHGGELTLRDNDPGLRAVITLPAK